MSVRTTVVGSWWVHPDDEADLTRYHTGKLSPQQADDVLSRAATTAIREQRMLGLDEWTGGEAGVGSTSHILGVSFQKATGTHFQFVPYRGTAPAVLDLVAGNVDIVLTDPISALPQVQAGTIKVYAVTASHRFPIMPDIPTVDEAGLPGFYMTNWYALFAPKRTPKTIIEKLNGIVVDALADPTVRARFADQGVETFPREQQTPEALRALQKADIDKWWPIIKAAGIKAE